MKFCGLQKVSLIDYPNKIASVLFTPGCNLRCPYCHNWRIAVNPQPPFLQEATTLEMLESRKKYVNAVVVTGGEPMMHKELPKFLGKLKERGFQVKVDTNGFYPATLQECLGSVDYVALDIKTSLENYHLLGAKDTSDFIRSVDILKAGQVPYEFRATIVPELITPKNIERFGEMVKGAKVFAFQQYVPQDTLDKRYESLRPYEPEIIIGFAETMKKFVKTVVLRI
jgi:pyruvate formate lyase activating enzyme